MGAYNSKNDRYISETTSDDFVDSLFYNSDDEDNTVNTTSDSDVTTTTLPMWTLTEEIIWKHAYMGEREFTLNVNAKYYELTRELLDNYYLDYVINNKTVYNVTFPQVLDFNIPLHVKYLESFNFIKNNKDEYPFISKMCELDYLTERTIRRDDKTFCIDLTFEAEKCHEELTRFLIEYATAKVMTATPRKRPTMFGYKYTLEISL